MKHRMLAIAPSLAEAVRYAGGWLFDQVMAGWDVTVLTADHSDARALKILGARARDLDSLLAAPLVLGPCLQAIAVRADLCDSDARVRRVVHTALAEGRAEVRFWGDEWPAGLGDSSGPVWHRLSVAARAFKAHALTAAAAPAGPDEDIETFRRAEVRLAPVPVR